jgi:hypothetical protein
MRRAALAATAERAQVARDEASNRADDRSFDMIAILHLIALLAVTGGVILIDWWLHRPL